MIGSGRDIAGICSSLADKGYLVKFHGYSALDKYLGLPALPYLWVETNADISVLARLFENLRFPGAQVADGAIDTPEATCYFRCLDPTEEKENNLSLSLFSFVYNWQSRRFHDPLGLYPLLRNIRSGKDLSVENEDTAVSLRDIRFNPEAGRYRLIMDSAMLLARYGIPDFFSGFSETLEHCRLTPPPGPEAQRAFLSCLVVSPRPDIGLEFLKLYGFIDELWPEFACFDTVDHSKEFHPEGNVWNHTLETFRHRKAGTNGAFDLGLSLGLLLHDSGKPISESYGNHRFEGHAELGASAAVRFLERLEFKPSLIDDVFFLVKNHMLPAALKRLPLVKTREIMASPLFPTLMELYRCDESSSFKGLDGYYKNSAAYQSYLKNVRNPYRSADGKKIGGRTIHRKM